MIHKTIIPFKPEQTASGDGLPGAEEVVTLFNSVTAFGPKCMQLHGDIYWFRYSICPDDNATGNSVTGQYSVDGGTTWITFHTTTSNEPVGDSSVFSEEVFIGQFEDVRFQFTNGADAQTGFVVTMSLDSQQRSASS